MTHTALAVAIGMLLIVGLPAGVPGADRDPGLDLPAPRPGEENRICTPYAVVDGQQVPPEFCRPWPI